MSDNRDSSSTATTEPDLDAQLEQEVKKEDEEEAALNAIKNAPEDEKDLVVKAGSSPRERRGN